MISTVDPQARHGHKTSARGFDGYKGHIAADPDSEIISATEVSAGNQGDAQTAADPIIDLLPDTDGQDGQSGQDGGQDRSAVYGDAAYGAAEFLEKLDDTGIEATVKTQPATNAGGRFTKDAFGIELDAGTVTCPNQTTVPIRRNRAGDGTADFGTACATCPLAARCTTSKSGRKVAVGRHERLLARARATSTDPARRADYRATRSRIERKLAHLMRHRHGRTKIVVHVVRRRAGSCSGWSAGSSRPAATGPSPGETRPRSGTVRR
ncbi:hypothetical protein B0E53_02640 [Micromonospora sp. MH33]|uniref:transposase n=1 Tax=Micromonospora sp. MH33 TaxID=1945509 RepID=UPI000D27F3B8|nr:transposase [Micromonospora sp. MH33]PSK65420.1 hypothetical protein B0E53_02640 [Micromonospora sp. MH33]